MQITIDLLVEFRWWFFLKKASPKATKHGMDSGISQELECSEWCTLVKRVENNGSNEDLLVCRRPACLDTLDNGCTTHNIFRICHGLVLHYEMAKRHEHLIKATE
jgi:hypothetical protein